MCSEGPWDLRWCMLSHCSTTTKVSAPNFASGPPSTSMVAPSSMQPFSACTAGTLALKFLRISSRLPGLAVMMAMTWIMIPSCELGGAAVAQQAAGQFVVDGDGVLAAATDYRAIDDHGVDATGLRHQPVSAGGLVVDTLQRSGTDGLGVEHHDIGRPAMGQHAAVGDAEHLGRPLCQMMHGLLDGEGLLVTHPRAQQG